MKTVVFLDLDDTLFQTARKCPPGLEVFPTTYGKGGQPVSYMTALQRYFLGWLGRDAELIPTTGRSLEAFRRVDLPFSSHAIVNHGATVLNPDGSRDEVWHARVQAQLTATRPVLEVLLERTRAHAGAEGLGIDAYWDGEADLPLYLVAKHRGLDMDALERLRQFWIAELNGLEGLYLFANGNNVSVLPQAVSKAAAVAYLLERLRQEEPLLSIGLGDSVSDVPFMALCDFVMLPSRGQLFEGLPRNLSEHR